MDLEELENEWEKEKSRKIRKMPKKLKEFVSIVIQHTQPPAMAKENKNG